MLAKEQLIHLVIEPIEAKGGKAYFVGGCVRDELLNKKPNDYDIVTNFTPAQLHTVFSKFCNTSKNAERFGVTIPVIEYNGKFDEVEIATFRKDLSKGRHPVVALDASIKEDAMRRDFTINALYEDKNGNIFDPTGFGLSDIKKFILRFVGEPKDRLSEDPLRAYRFMRFLANGFTNPYTIEELEEFKKGIDFSGVSKERKLKEIKKTFSSRHFLPNSASYFAGTYLGIFKDIGLEDIFKKMSLIEQSWKWHIEGAIVRCVNSEKLYKGEDVKDFTDKEPVYHGTVFDHTLNVWKEMNKIIFLDKGLKSICVDFENEEKRFLLIMSSILHDIGKIEPDGKKHGEFQWGDRAYIETVPRVHAHDFVGIPLAEAFCKNIGMSNEEVKFVTTLVGQHMKAHKFADTKHKFKILEFVHQPLFKDIMILAQADSRGSIKTVYNETSSVEQNLSKPIVVECINTSMPKPILNGDDLIKQGLKPGPLFAKMLRLAYIHQYEANETSKEKLFNFVKNIK